MPAPERSACHVSTALVGLTGLVLAAMKYLLEPDPDGFSLYGHPWQPHALHAHVLAAPLLVLAVGLVAREHVWVRLRNPQWRSSRRSGLLLLLLLLPMIGSGYLLQTASSEPWRRALVAVHLATGTAFLAGWIVHLVIAGRGGDRRGRGRRRIPSPGP